MPPFINVKIVGDASGLKAALKDGGDDVDTFGKIVNGLKVGGQIAAVATVITGLASATMDTVRAGQDSLAAQAKFAKAIENSGAATEGWQANVETAIDKGAKLAFTDDEIRDSLATLSGSTHNMNASLSDLAAAQDLARGATVPLSTATDAITAALAGSDKALKGLLPSLKDSASVGETMGRAFALTAGQADEFAASGEAAGIRTGIGFSELQETIGEKLVPAFNDMMEALQPILDAFMELIKVLLPAITPLISVVAKVFVTLAHIIKAAIDFAADLFGKLNNLIQPLKDLYDKLAALNPFGGLLDNITGAFNGFDFNPFAVTPAGPGASTRAGGNAIPTHNGGVTINIFGDPSVIEARVTKALRDYSRRNGALSIFTPGRN